MFNWTDPDNGDVYEIMYVVTQTADEGSEYLQYRIPAKDAEWVKLPPFVYSRDLKQIEDYFMGPAAMYGETYEDTPVKDGTHKEIKVGDRVRIMGYDETKDDPKVYHGRIWHISDVDGDVDDDTGRSVMVPPYVYVKFDDGTEEQYRSFHWWQDNAFECDELEKIDVDYDKQYKE
jgi:hypothetical protein